MSVSFGPESHRTYRLVRVIQWTLPLALTVITVTYEIYEHVLIPGELSTHSFFSGEIFFFGILGPSAVAVALGYIRHLLLDQLEVQARVERLNRDLEAIVAERTRHLEETRRELEAKNLVLAQANAELRQLDKMKSDFVALVSHSFRAPLTNLSGALELFAQDMSDFPDPLQRTLNVLIHESNRLRSLVKTILDLSYLEAGKLNLNAGPVSLEPMLVRAAKSMLSGHPDRQLFLDVPQGVPPAWADEMYLEEVVCNLVSNAVKYSPEGSPIHISVNMCDDMLAVAVTDHGPGIPPDEQSRIFKAFHRTASAERVDTSGAGLGLYFAKKLIEAHGGRIWVEVPAWPDEDYPGARFTFTLPVAGKVPDEGESCDEKAPGGR